MEPPQITTGPAIAGDCPERHTGSQPGREELLPISDAAVNVTVSSICSSFSNAEAAPDATSTADDDARNMREADIRRLYATGTQRDVLNLLYDPEEVSKCVEQIDNARELLKVLNAPEVNHNGSDEPSKDDTAKDDPTTDSPTKDAASSGSSDSPPAPLQETFLSHVSDTDESDQSKDKQEEREKTSNVGYYALGAACLILIALIVVIPVALLSKNSSTDPTNTISAGLPFPVTPDTPLPSIPPSTESPTRTPTQNPSRAPFTQPPIPDGETYEPSSVPTNVPTYLPSLTPSRGTNRPTPPPSLAPSGSPTAAISVTPTPPLPATLNPTVGQSASPSLKPTPFPTAFPTSKPTTPAPTSAMPTVAQSASPSLKPTPFPTAFPTSKPTTPAPTSSMPTLPQSTSPATKPTWAPIHYSDTPLFAYLSFLGTPEYILLDPTTPQGKAYQWLMGENVQNINIVRVPQRYALVSLDLALHQPGPETAVAYDWNSFILWQPTFGVPDKDVCEWEGITCNENKEVIGIKWSNKNLNGTVIPEITLLDKLEKVDLAENQITGDLQLFWDLPALTHLYLFKNRLSGTIPNDRPAPENLVQLYLGHNQLTGTLPPAFWSTGGPRGLRYLILHHNQLNGTLPEGMALRHLFYLDLSNNSFQGPVPADWTTYFTQLRVIYLANNQLSGELPSNFALLGNSRLKQCYINNNRFTGSFPSDGWSDYSLTNMDIASNSFDNVDRRVCKLAVMEEGEMVEFRADCNVCQCESACHICVGGEQ